MTTTPVRSAARAIALHAPGTPAERYQMLDMLGLLDDTGSDIRPEPETEREQFVPGLENGDYAPGRALKMYEPAPHPELLTSPPGLRNLPPLPAEQPKPKPARKPKRPARTAQQGRPSVPRARGGAAQCGTLAGRSRHNRLGEPVCRDCLDALNDYQRKRKREKRLAAGLIPGKRGPEAQCGTPAGAKAHYRRGEQACGKCRESRRAEGRRRWDEMPPEKRTRSNEKHRDAAARRAERNQQDQQQAS